MIVYRVSHLKYTNSTLHGIGAEKVGGRWNEIGTRAVYCSENISLALLEYYVHSENIANLPREIVVAKILIPDEFFIHQLKELPEGWNHYPYTKVSTSIFTKMAKQHDFLGLRVPSTIVPLESNIILNPLFKNFGAIEVIEFLSLGLDARLKSSIR